MYLVIPAESDVLDDTSGHVIEDLERAVVLRDALALDARTCGDPVEYRLYRLVDVDESELSIQEVGSDG